MKNGSAATSDATEAARRAFYALPPESRRALFAEIGMDLLVQDAPAFSPVVENLARVAGRRNGAQLGDEHPLLRMRAGRPADPAASEIMMRGIETYRARIDTEETARDEAEAEIA